MNTFVSASLLSANFGNLEKDIEMLNNSNTDWLHVDVMDGIFVPNISFGQPVIKYIKKLAKKPLDVHLMIMDPDRYFESFKEVGADILTVHYEACTHVHRSLTAIKALEMKAGIVLNPHSPISLLEDCITECDMVLLMSVNPGFGGQKFIENTYSKISRLKELIEKKNPSCLIEIDGGVCVENAAKLAQYGANVLVAGNAIFSSQDPKQTINILKQM